MNINDKIKQILIDKNLSPSYFADEIGVQRSSISHILSGRNRPSFDIIQKIIRRFPELGYDWIMEDEHSAASQPAYENRNNFNRSVGDQPNRINGSGSVSSPSYPNHNHSAARNQRTEIPPATISSQPFNEPVNFQEPVGPLSSSDRKVERILIFYTDGSFREYMPTTGA